MRRTRGPAALVATAVVMLLAVGVIAAIVKHDGGSNPTAPLTPTGASFASGASTAGDQPQIGDVHIDAPAARSVDVSFADPVAVTHLDLSGADQVLLPGGISATGHVVIDGDLTVGGTLVIRPDGTQLGRATIRKPTRGPITVHADGLTAGGQSTGQTSATAQQQGEITLFGDDVVAAGPVTFGPTRVTSLSWAGGGSVAAGPATFAADHLGVTSTSVRVALAAANGALALFGHGAVTQVWAEGQPLLATTASVDAIRTDVSAAAGDSNTTTYLTWAPRNTGRVVMAITAIHATSGPGDWVNLALATLPPMFGGEAMNALGGDTAGLGQRGRGPSFFGLDSADPITSALAPHHADRRDLSLSIPAGTPPGDYSIVLTIEGNFAPVTFTATIHVR